MAKKTSEHRKHLIGLSSAVARALVLIDKEMKKPSNENRGKRIAEITNSLEMANDIALRFGLDYGFNKITKLKEQMDF